MKSIKILLKNNSGILRLAAILHNLIYLSVPIKGTFKGVFIRNTKFKVKGHNVNIVCKPKTRLTDCSFFVRGNNTKIIIGENCILRNVEIWIEDDYSEVIIGDNNLLLGGQVAATEGEKIVIGNDCMFSANVQIRNGDSHPIFDLELNKRINYAKSVTIADRVWIGNGVTILKNTNIGSDSVIGTGSILSGECEGNAIYVGIPARKIKGGIRWKKER
jgi:acetyltransferase-like isoleucine patch superfamily enzyme